MDDRSTGGPWPSGAPRGCGWPRAGTRRPRRATPSTTYAPPPGPRPARPRRCAGSFSHARRQRAGATGPPGI